MYVYLQVTCCKGKGQACCIDSYFALPCDNDMPCILACCFFTFLVNYKPVMAFEKVCPVVLSYIMSIVSCRRVVIIWVILTTPCLTTPPPHQPDPTQHIHRATLEHMLPSQSCYPQNHTTPFLTPHIKTAIIDRPSASQWHWLAGQPSRLLLSRARKWSERTSKQPGDVPRKVYSVTWRR